MLDINLQIPDSMQDNQSLIRTIAMQEVRVDTQTGVRQSTIGELIVVWWQGHGHDTGGIEKEDAKRHLRRIGIRVEKDTVWIANRCEPLSQLLKDTPWANDWARPLREIYKAKPSEKTIRFNPRIVSRATGLPIELFREG
ncbi:MAG: hypothetical protein ACE5GF_09310 [Thermodesulfobacteriota bacterium]